ncbi:MAG: PBSX family phage terminase large subunit [Oscillospiraceae bacterium]|jgi:PBSX family phage terminase large subunit|nr:PBSX family phage terminase large subunit [Oscillospiraceae bacterium]
MTLRQIQRFSSKQLLALNWWHPGGEHADCDAVICDGAVRSGKTMCMGISFIGWATAAFRGCSFALCGKTVTSLRRNVVTPLLPLLRELGFICTEKRSQSLIEIEYGGRRNRFYLFGGKDEGSAALIQGMTLGGVLLDEVALMPRSFVEQAIARCSLESSKLWFNCNPEYPAHWFHTEWICRAAEKNCLYLHFRMEDNPSLSPAMLERYKKLYSGAFYARFVEGRWSAAEGLVYPMFSAEKHVFDDPPAVCEAYWISCDYGTVNPASFGLWGLAGGRWHRLREYYWDSRKCGEQRTDEEHYAALEALAGAYPLRGVICDPSAASFLECIRRHGRFTAIPANNDVLYGIRRVADALQENRLAIHRDCADCLREFSLYRWEPGGGKDAPRKENDHAMDDLRYFVTTALRGESTGGLFATVRRGGG